MRRILSALILSEWIVLITCLSHQYFFINEPLTWTEAQTYCRQKHSDLATIKSTEDVDQLIKTLSSADHSSEVWIGLFSEINWIWSDGFTGSGAEFRDWETSSYEPDFASANQFCVLIDSNGRWWDANCQYSYSFICNNGTQLYPEFVSVNETMTWSNAQTFCRENFIDLATVKNVTENEMAQSLVPPEDYLWIGLFREPYFNWSDGNSTLFSNWDSVLNPISSMAVICSVTSVQRSGKWSFKSCEEKLPFVCYGPCCGTQMNPEFILVNTTMDWPSAQKYCKENFTDLATLHDRLKEKDVSGVTLKWRQVPNRKVFQKEGKRKKTEL
ncbi:macrophage mannose receptor 1 [Kryptolebias marmoratus]|uniref:macrophage mannose receptor 1 n=1 Tax=Kryptolebias marmoratus TaxID=37003 RepID=UPI0018ACFE74|nr:macrophage mannose receptor 1 [Kryptolebias marmoratus]